MPNNTAGNPPPNRGDAMFTPKRADSGMQALKLVLMGVIAVAIPILFILQHNRSKTEEKDANEYKSQVAELKAELAYKNKLLDLIAYKVIDRDTIKITDTVRTRDTVKVGRIFLDYSFKNLIVVMGFLGDGSGGIEKISYYRLPLNKNLEDAILGYKHKYSDSMAKALGPRPSEEIKIKLRSNDELYKLLIPN